MSLMSILSYYQRNAGAIADTLANANIVCDGNSLTFGYQATQSYPFQLAALPPLNSDGATIQNFGVNSQTTPQMAADAATQIDALISGTHRNLLIAWEIGNDIYFNGSVASAQSNWQSYCLARKAAGWTVLCLTITPRYQTTPFGDTPAQFLTKQGQANTWLLANYATFSDGVLDLTTDSRLTDYNNLTYFQADKTHFTNAGYTVIAAMVLAKLKIL